jgi:hypothetical protein
MINYSNALIDKIIVHYVGSKLNDDGCELSKKDVQIEDFLEKKLVNFFISPFKQSEYFEFWHQVDLALNEVYSFCSEIFRDPSGQFIKQSQALAKTLYEYSSHPKIKAGELCIVYFSQVIVDDAVAECVGLFKSETKDTFLEYVKDEKGNFQIQENEGIDMTKIEKGCLVFNISGKYKVAIIDQLSKETAKYWNEDFLKVAPCNDDFHFTKDILAVTKNFVSKSGLVSGTDDPSTQIDLLNRSISYFKNHDNFDQRQFETEVFKEKELISSFRKYDDAYRNDNKIQPIGNFQISPEAVKKQVRAFKKVLKLDADIQIHIQGSNMLIEKGFDSNVGKKFYKIYFDSES